jgi:hypothetical protein
MMASQSGAPALTVCANLVLTAAGGYSTVAVMGRDDIAAEVRELAVVGGTGRFRMATGYVLWRTANSSSGVVSGPDATIELDVYVATGGGGADSSAPVSPVGGSGGSSSAAAAVRVGGWVVSAVLVAVVVGSYVR